MNGTPALVSRRSSWRKHLNVTGGSPTFGLHTLISIISEAQGRLPMDLIHCRWWHCTPQITSCGVRKEARLFSVSELTQVPNRPLI